MNIKVKFKIKINFFLKIFFLSNLDYKIEEKLKKGLNQSEKLGLTRTDLKERNYITRVTSFHLF